MKLPDKMLTPAAKSRPRLWWFIVLCLIVVLLTACSSEEPAETTQAPQEPSATATDAPPTEPPPPPATFTSVPPTTEAAPPTATATEASTPEPVTGVIQDVSLFLREGPSTLYASQGMFPMDTELLIQSRAPGDEWVSVVVPGGESGWMAVSYITFTVPLEDILLEPVAFSIVISGTVRETGGAPVSDVNLAVTALGNPDLRVDTFTGEDGVFYIYIPPNSSGSWNVGLVGLGCESHVVDENCELSGYVPLGDQVRIILPPEGPVEFLFEETALNLSGEVEGQSTIGFRIFARREDGAVSWATSDPSGVFKIPLLPGEWQVYAVNLTSGRQGNSVVVVVEADKDPEDVSLPAP